MQLCTDIYTLAIYVAKHCWCVLLSFFLLLMIAVRVTTQFCVHACIHIFIGCNFHDSHKKGTNTSISIGLGADTSSITISKVT